MTLAALLRRMRPCPADARRDDPVARSAARSHVGRVRAVNEDRVLDRPDRGLWAIADGMGGHAAGDVAAAAVIDALDRLADATDAGTPDPATIRAVLERANAAVRAARLDPARASGATVVALHLDDGVATILWAGDSRAYRRRGGALELLTRDHSVVQELIDAGTLAPAMAASHRHAHVVTRAIGAAAEVEIDTMSVAVAPGDMLLLCSDGLSGPVPATMIAGRLRAPPAQAADALIEAALCAGGRDNVSVVTVEVPG